MADAQLSVNIPGSTDADANWRAKVERLSRDQQVAMFYNLEDLEELPHRDRPGGRNVHHHYK